MIIKMYNVFPQTEGYFLQLMERASELFTPPHF